MCIFAYLTDNKYETTRHCNTIKNLLSKQKFFIQHLGVTSKYSTGYGQYRNLILHQPDRQNPFFYTQMNHILSIPNWKLRFLV